MVTTHLPSAVVIDASTWVSRVLPNDSNHATAFTWINLHLARSGALVSPVLLVTETASAVSRITGIPARGHLAASQLLAMPEVSLVQIDQALVEDATDLAASLRLKGADAYYVALAMTLGLPLVTFDKEQLTRTTGVITTIRP